MCRSPGAQLIFDTIKLRHCEHLLAAARSTDCCRKRSTKQQLTSAKILTVKAQLNKSAVMDLACLDFNELHFGFSLVRALNSLTLCDVLYIAVFHFCYYYPRIM